MKEPLIKAFALIIATVLFLLFSCKGIESGEGDEPAAAATSAEGLAELKAATWNVQTFFDAVNDGTEYTDFQKSKTWGTAAYTERLVRLCASIRSIDADVIALEEIEKQEILYDISNFLAGEWNPRKNYTYASFSREDGASIGIGVLSRFPLGQITVHSLDVRSEPEKMPSMRPIMEVPVYAGGRELVLFLNHWKSKSGGEEETEKWRNMEEGVLSACVERSLGQNKNLLIMGDFNRDIRDFAVQEDNTVLLRKFSEGMILPQGIKVSCPWFKEDGKLVRPGSYYYQDSWSRIDNIFYGGNTKVVNFMPETRGPWCDSSTQIPERYSIWSGTGYSDHLPLSCTVCF